MKRLKLENHLSDENFVDLIKKEKNAAQLRIWQILFYVKSNYGVQAKSISPLFGISVSTIYHHVQNFNKLGKEGVLLRPKGGRKRFFLSLKKEKDLLDLISNKALKGLVLTMNDIRLEVEVFIGHAVSDDYIWDLMNRHNWKKKSPRPKHPDQDIEKQNEFKKKSKKTWQPPN